MSNSPCAMKTTNYKAKPKPTAYKAKPTAYRSYSLVNTKDHNHTINGRCPDYALHWPHNENAKHWPIDHDYFIGNNIFPDNDSNELRNLREIFSKKLRNGTLCHPIIFCDLDGVLVNFEEGVHNKFGKHIDEIKPPLLWGVINKSNTFFETLPWMPKGKELWNSIKQYHPIILTGVPGARENLKEQKLKWCQRELGPDVYVITCLTNDKPKYCLSNSILIDDRTNNLKAWNDMGGKFILYDEEHLEPILERTHRYMNSDFPQPQSPITLPPAGTK